MTTPLSPHESSARRIAEAAHTGQVDRAGNPYFGHIERVAQAVKAAGGSETQVVAAYLHDVIEDTDKTSAELLDAGVSTAALTLIAILTRQDEVSYEDYLQQIRSSPDALLIKQCDMADNMDPARTALLDDETRERLRLKYEKAVAFLTATT